MKCDVCGKKVETTFLGKIVGSYMKNKNSKKKVVCPECQKKHTKEELLKKL
ncbi:MAG: hypothetical protein KJ583_01905 [Nanoarchaeota archaeon]|nr:hypothetical protein [Nanoarchaeota archaeon]MBU1269956.1 hypothetical protein [Nanoarchaeota archaeon]MBU1604047.1 hypothetical protein [Nanoarchaeota archaeon]MBU2442542.1 hypothetical protein [Nanoarchaeota archaeon]